MSMQAALEVLAKADLPSFQARAIGQMAVLLGIAYFFVTHLAG